MLVFNLNLFSLHLADFLGNLTFASFHIAISVHDNEILFLTVIFLFFRPRFGFPDIRPIYLRPSTVSDLSLSFIIFFSLVVNVSFYFIERFFFFYISIPAEEA